MPSKLLIVSGLIGSIVLAGCTPKTTETAETGASTQTEETQAMPAEGSAAPAAESETAENGLAMEKEEADYEIEMSNFAYSINEIMAAPGDVITIKLINVDGHHDFDIDELEIDTAVIETGEEMTVTVTIPEDAESGTEYAYYCSVGSHRAQGMEGMITVE